MIGFVEQYPVSLGLVDATAATNEAETQVEVFQLRPGDVDRLTAWAGVHGYPGADGGVLLFDAGRVIGPVRLGEFVVRDHTGALRIESSAAEMFAAYQPITRD